MSRLRTQVGYKLGVIRTLVRAGVVRPMRPGRARQVRRVVRERGVAFASGAAVGALRHPTRTAIVDELGTLTYAELEARTNALARAFAAAGIGEGCTVAIMCRNHRGFMETTIASAKLGADALYLSTELAAPAVARIVERERPALLVYDEELAAQVRDAGRSLTRLVAFCETGRVAEDPLLEQWLAAESPDPLPAPGNAGRTIILTSGTTGTPKAAVRTRPASRSASAGTAAPILSRIPFRSGQKTLVAVPLYHLWGYSQLLLGLALSSTYVLQRHFDAEDALRAIDEHQVSVLVAVPLMLQRMLQLDEKTRSRYDTSCLRVIALSGSPLPGQLALDVMDAFGDVLYNLYGTTETGAVTIAAPHDLRAAPGTAGRPPLGAEMRLLDADGRDVPRGASGRIFVTNGFLFNGYTTGENREVIDGFVRTGDLGHFDEAGRLFVDGREDDMIISGGENVYPREIEDLLAGHEQIAEAAVVAVPDEEFGQRLKAFVVPRNGYELTESLVKEFVRDNLARYKVPREVVFLETLPRNAAGKVLKRELSRS
jgi:fatty-acyl-CoA synthase